MGKKFAYCRVSTSEKSAKQDFERQLYILEHSHIQFDEIFVEHISGGVRGDQRKEFNRMLGLFDCDGEDLVCFPESSRFGRNYIDCFEMLDIITQDKLANVKFLSNGIELEGGKKMNPYTWMTVSQFFIQDEFLKRQIGYNTSNALQRKKEQGVQLGRPTIADTDERKVLVKQLRAEKKTIMEIHEITGIPKSTVARLAKLS